LLPLSWSGTCIRAIAKRTVWRRCLSVSAKFDGLFGKMFEDHIQRATA
jgi:hypothetical protein